MNTNMENFFIDDNFYSDLDEYIDSLLLEIEYDSLEHLPDDFKVEAFESEKRQAFGSLDHDRIMEFIEDTYIDDLPESYFDNYSNEVLESLKKSFDIEAFKKTLPHYYYSTNKKFTITKQDLIDKYEK